MKVHQFITACFLIVFAGRAAAQSTNIGIPFIKNFTKKTYSGGTQNWGVVQDARGVVYFANNEGMLQFDGKEWRCYPLPNKTIVRSLAIDKSGIIYAGGQNEFGYFQPGEKGDWAFHSLRPAIPEAQRNFADVWNIAINGEGVFFRTRGKLYRYHEGKMSVIGHPEPITFLGLLGKRVVVQDGKTGLWYFENGRLHPIEGTKQLTHSPMVALLPTAEKEWLIVTLQSGLFKFDGQQTRRWAPADISFIKSAKPYSAAVFPDGRIAIGTTFEGLLIVHPDGRTWQHLHKENGLLTNNVLSMLADKDHHLWLGLDNGISYVLTDAPFSRFSPDGKAQGAGYDVQVFDDKIYFATSNGLFFTEWKNYYSPFENNRFKEVPNAKGQAWGLDVVDNELLLAHHSGSYLVQGSKAERNNYPNWGYWLFKKMENRPGLLVAGTYNGLSVYDKKGGHWQFRNKLEGFAESSRFVEQDGAGNFWVAHPYKGIYKIRPDADYRSCGAKKYGLADGLASDLKNHVFKINEDLIFCSETGIFTYDAETDRFKPYDEYNKLFGEKTGVKRLFETPEGDIWYVTENELGLLDVQDKSILKKVIKEPLPYQIREQMVGGFELVCPADAHNVFIGTENGFIHFDPKRKASGNQSFQLILNEFSCTSNGDSLISRGLFFENGRVSAQQPAGQIPTLPNRMNAFHFGFSATDFTEPGALKFKYYLEGLEDGWPDWSVKPEKEYTNLLPGSYAFHVKALNLAGAETEELSFRFEILQPWYWTTAAKAIYALVALAFAAGGILFFRSKYYKQKEKVVQSEKEIGRLKNERLELELAHKNRELVSTTVHLQHKNETLRKIKTALEKIKKESRDPGFSQTIGKVIKMMEMEENSESGWEQFTSHFNEIHPGFFDRLREQFPELSHKDLKLCAYLRMNLSTKEVAILMNNTVRGVEGGRYRLRKKFGLDNKANLTEFILRY